MGEKNQMSAVIVIRDKIIVAPFETTTDAHTWGARNLSNDNETYYVVPVTNPDEYLSSRNQERR